MSKIRATLRKGDGFGNTTPHLRSEVETLQNALVKSGYKVSTDGLFGTQTKRAVKAFQKSRSLTPDGIVGPNTWRALDKSLAPAQRMQDYSDIPGFETFHGDLGWLHEQEGHAGKPYWPGGRSGVTLDPGFDLGRQNFDTAKIHYIDVWSIVQTEAIQNVMGVRGKKAKEALAASKALQSIRISRRKALSVMPNVAVKYWRQISTRFTGIKHEDTPRSVQTAMLSLAYNRRARNKDLEVLRQPIDEKRWIGVADLISEMQQDHELYGVRRRRRMEADLIRMEVVT